MKNFTTQENELLCIWVRLISEKPSAIDELDNH